MTSVLKSQGLFTRVKFYRIYQSHDWNNVSFDQLDQKLTVMVLQAIDGCVVRISPFNLHACVVVQVVCFLGRADYRDDLAAVLEEHCDGVWNFHRRCVAVLSVHHL